MVCMVDAPTIRRAVRDSAIAAAIIAVGTPSRAVLMRRQHGARRWLPQVVRRPRRRIIAAEANAAVKATTNVVFRRTDALEWRIEGRLRVFHGRPVLRLQIDRRSERRRVLLLSARW